MDTKREKYKYSLSLTSQFYFCGVPFRLDTAPKCSMNCLYCFAMSRGGRRTSWNLLADPKSLERKFNRVLNQHNISDVTAEVIAHRMPVHFGGISDPFAENVVIERSRQILKILAQYEFPVILSTKNASELCREKTISVLKELKYLMVQVSLSSYDKKFSSVVEPKAEDPKNRIACIDRLSKAGIHCICRLQPLFQSQMYNIIHELIPRLGEAGCKHVAVEHLKLPVERKVSGFENMLEKLGWDAYEWYRKRDAILVGREWLLPNHFKWENLQPVIRAIHKAGMTFGAADYGLYHLGDTDCCCGIDGTKVFRSWFRGNFTYIIRNSKSKILKLSALGSYWLPKLSIRRIMNSNCRIVGKKQNLGSYMRMKWNRPGTPNAPDAFLGVKCMGTRDSEGDYIYLKQGIWG